MRRTWRTQRRRLIAGTVGLAMGIICLADRADSQAMTEVTFMVVNNLFSTPAFVFLFASTSSCEIVCVAVLAVSPKAAQSAEGTA